MSLGKTVVRKSLNPKQNDQHGPAAMGVTASRASFRWTKSSAMSAGAIAMLGLCGSILAHAARPRSNRPSRQQNAHADVAAPFAPYAGLVWKPIGPQPTLPQGSAAGTPGATAGRVTAIAVDTTDATGDTVLIAGADSGVWKTTDGGSTWTPLTDSQPTLAIGALAIAPSNHLTIYAGTGVQQWIGADVYSGVGVLKSLDGGSTWAVTCTGVGSIAGATCPFFGPFSNGSTPGAGARISAIGVNPANANQLLVAAEIFSGTDSQPGEPGIYCSDDQGATWILLNLHPQTAGSATGTAVFYAGATTAFAGLGRAGGDPQNGIYESTNANASCGAQTWSPVGGGGLPAQSHLGNIALSVAANNASDPSNADSTKIILYAAIADASAQSQSLAGLFGSVNGGATWVKTSAPDFCTPLCGFDLVIGVDPADSSGNTVFAGGSNTSNGTLMRSTDGGQMWSSIAASSDGTVIHAGQHAIAFAPGGSNSPMYVGNDGGTWSTTGRTASGAIGWRNLNGGLELTEFYGGLAINPSEPTIAIGGTQGNGTQMYSGAAAWTNLGICADGGAAIADPFSASTVYASCANHVSANLWRSFDAANSFTSIGAGTGAGDPIDPVAPFVADAMTQGRIYFGTNRLWQSSDAGNSWAAISGNLTGSAGNGVALTTVGVDPANASVIYTGAEDGTIFVSKNASAGAASFANVSNGLPSREVRRVVVDPSDATGNTAYAAYEGFSVDVSISGIATDLQGHVFKTTNGGANWIDISCHTIDCAQPGANDLPNLPVHDLALDRDDPSRQTIYAATDAGVFVTATGGASWSPLGSGLPNAAVMSLVLHEPSRILRAATHGRGVWDLALPALAGTPAFELSDLSQSSAAVGRASALPLTLTGRGFTSASTVLWNGSANGVTIAGTPSATSISVDIAPSLLSSPGNARIQVSDVSQNPNVTNALTFSVIGTAPTLSSVIPNSASAEGTSGTSDLPIVLSGANFAANAQATVEGGATGIVTSSVSAAGTQINATLSHTLLQYGGEFFVGVTNPGSGGGASAQPALFTVNNSTPPANDNFANATPIATAIFSDVVDSFAATVEATDPVPTCSPSGQALGKTVWWKFSSGAGGNVSANTSGSPYDTLIAVFTGSPGSFVQTACNHGPTPGSSQVSFTAAAATTYYYMVGVANPAAASTSPDLESGGKTALNLTGPAPVGMTAAPTAQTITAGSSANFTVAALSPPFAGQVALTVSGCPTNATCTLLANTLTAGTGTTLSVVTSSDAAAAPDPGSRKWQQNPASLKIPVAELIVVLAFVLVARRKLEHASVPRTSAVPLACVALVLAIYAVGCGSDPPPPPTTNMGTPVGSYTLTVMGTANTVTATATMTLTVD